MRFMLTSPAENTAEQLIAALRERGLQVDTTFPPVVVERATGRYVLRGEGAADAIEKAARELGLEIYPDLPIGPSD